MEHLGGGALVGTTLGTEDTAAKSVLAGGRRRNGRAHPRRLLGHNAARPDRRLAAELADSETVIAPLLQLSRAGRATRLTGFAVAAARSGWNNGRAHLRYGLVADRDESGPVAGALQTLIEATERRAQRALRDRQATDLIERRPKDNLLEAHIRAVTSRRRIESVDFA